MHPQLAEATSQAGSEVLAGLILAIVGAALGYISAYMVARQNAKVSSKLLSSQLLADRSRLFLPLRQNALERYWGLYAKARMGDRDISQKELDEYLALSIWLPADLRDQCIKSLAELSDQQAVRRIQSAIVHYVDSLAREPAEDE